MKSKPKDNTPSGWKNEPPEFFADGVQASLESIREDCAASDDLTVKAFPITLWGVALTYARSGDPLPPELSSDRLFLRLIGAIIAAQDQVTPLSVWREWRQDIQTGESAIWPPVLPPGESETRRLREGWKSYVAKCKASNREPLGHPPQDLPFGGSDNAPANARKIGEIVPTVRKSEGALYVEKSRARKRMREVLERWQFAFEAWYQITFGATQEAAQDAFRQKLDRL